MQYHINQILEVKIGQYWRDVMNVRHIIDTVNNIEITAIDENTSIPRKYKPLAFYRKFTFES